MKTARNLLFITILFLFCSCATVFYGGRQKVIVNSDPPGANVYVNGKNMKQTTPCEIKVNRKQPETLKHHKNVIIYTFKMDDYYDAEYIDVSKFNWLTGVDVIFYIAPALVDLAVGAHRVYSSNVEVILNPKNEVVYVNPGKTNIYQFEKRSDVDKNIPISNTKNPYSFALIIGNEDYSSHQLDLSTEINVDYARNDASAFKEYALNTLGIPEKNITFLLDATTGQMNQGIAKLNLILKNTQGKAEVLVYYAGHGLPDEVTKEAYIMPVDVSGKNASNGIKLKDMYQKLTEYPSKKITVFIDACFSGGARNQGLLAARSVKVKPKENILTGNLVVFSASSGEQSSLPYKDENHGLFTYFLLKKLQETQGNVSYRELSKYIKENVSLESVLINEKEQTPQINVSNTIINEWENYNMK